MTQNLENSLYKREFSRYTVHMLERTALKQEIERALSNFRVVELVGPRQSGKTTLARVPLSHPTPSTTSTWKTRCTWHDWTSR